MKRFILLLGLASISCGVQTLPPVVFTSTPAPTLAATVTPPVDFAIVEVTAEILLVRAKPTTDSESITEYLKGQNVIVYEYVELPVNPECWKWYRVDGGWICADWTK